MSHRLFATARMVEARTPCSPSFCCSSANSSRSAAGLRWKTSSLTASREPLRTWKRAFRGRGAEVTLRDPGDGLDVAQPPGPGLDVGLEVVGGVVGLQVPRGLLAHLGLEELLHRPESLGRESLAHGGEQLRIARDEARLEQRRHDTDVADAFLGALGH